MAIMVWWRYDTPNAHQALSTWLSHSPLTAHDTYTIEIVRPTINGEMTPLCCRLQAWAILLSEDKRSMACQIKSRALAEVVGAHLRFLARTGTWEQLLLDFNQMLQTAFFEREQAVEMLSEQVTLAAHGVPGHARPTLGELLLLSNVVTGINF